MSKGQPFSLVTSLAYVAGIAMQAEHASLREVSNKNLYRLLSKLVHLISHRKQSYHVTHVKARTDLPGALTRGNRRADVLVMLAQFQLSQTHSSRPSPPTNSIT